MAQLREGSVIKKPTGDEVIATVNDIPTKVSELINDSDYATKQYVDDNVGGEIYHVGITPPSDTSLFWVDTSE